METDVLRIVSVSGGKDSTALYCLSNQRWGKDGYTAVFADTGNEHPVTLNYIRNLPSITGGAPIQFVKADYTDRLAKKGLTPSDSVFLDMMLAKGMVPHLTLRFCTTELKMNPITLFIDSIRGDREVRNYVGIRRGESRSRSTAKSHEYSNFFNCTIVRPMVNWTEEDVFRYLKEQGVEPNPLYANGSSRVGCYPCIFSGKKDLASLPDWVWDKLEHWEKTTGFSWFHTGLVPGEHITTISSARKWCKTQRGGWKYDMFAEEPRDVPSCMASWGICE